MIPWLVATFFAVVATGPAGVEWLEKHRARRDQPDAKVIRLPEPPVDPVLLAVRRRRRAER